MSRPDSSAAHLLIVEDDHGIREQLRNYLTGKGYWCSAAPDAASANRLIELLKFDLLIVDVLMPGMDGRTFTRQLRARSDVPVIMLTALDGLDNILAGFDAGTDDYLPKPFEPAELVVRIESLLRRAATPDLPEEPREIAFGGHRFDALREELWFGERQIKLTQREIRILKRLARTPNQPVDRKELIDRTDEPADFDQNRAVDVRISRLRQKIEQDPRHPRHLITVRGEGYKLITG